MPQMPKQLGLPFGGRGEAPRDDRSVEVSTAESVRKPPGASDLLERVLSRANLQVAFRRVKKNKGSPGIDGMSVGELGPHLVTTWPQYKEALLSGRYRPSPVKRQLIPQARWGPASARHPDGARPVHSTGPPAGPAADLRPWVQRAQLWVSARARCPRRRRGGATLRAEWAAHRGGCRPGEVLRPGQPRHPHGPSGPQSG